MLWSRTLSLCCLLWFYTSVFKKWIKLKNLTSQNYKGSNLCGLIRSVYYWKSSVCVAKTTIYCLDRVECFYNQSMLKFLIYIYVWLEQACNFLLNYTVHYFSSTNGRERRIIARKMATSGVLPLETNHHHETFTCYLAVQCPAHMEGWLTCCKTY